MQAPCNPTRGHLCACAAPTFIGHLKVNAPFRTNNFYTPRLLMILMKEALELCGKCSLIGHKQSEGNTNLECACQPFVFNTIGWVCNVIIHVRNITRKEVILLTVQKVSCVNLKPLIT